MKYFITLILWTLTLTANELNVETEQNLTIWIAIFSLAIVGVIGLYFTSEQFRKFKEDSDRRDNIHKRQDEMLSSMSENIQNMAKNTVISTEKLSKENSSNISTNITKVIDSETKLLSMTTNLIEFLRIKSKKIEILNESFSLSNLLNDVTGTLKTSINDIELDLIYDIDSNIPEYLKGDTLNITTSIVNIILFCIENNASNITIKITKDNKFNKGNNLYFSIHSNVIMDIENDDNIFNSNYNETTNSYDSLGLFIAKELAILMDGDIIAKNHQNGIEFLFFTSFTKDIEIKKIDTQLTSKNIYISSVNTEYSLVLKNMLLSLNHNVDTDSKNKFLLSLIDFNKYDLIILDEELLTFKVTQSLKDSNVKLISCSNIFNSSKNYPNNIISDLELNKPITKLGLNCAINKIFEDSNVKTITKSKKLAVYKDTFKNTQNITLEKFVEFRGTKVLLVEDNLINQKVFIGILSKSAMNIVIASDGQEALSILNNNIDNNFDIIFMDINMPIMDGYTASKLIRENNIFDELPIVALSALTSPTEIDKMFASGMNGYLAKPMKKDSLFTVFTTFIKDRKEDRRGKKREKETIFTLDGLNIVDGILHSNGNELFYKEILLEFNDAYKDSGKVFKKLVDDFRYEQLRMLCVDMNGLSASIGAEDMHNLTTEILQKILYKKYDLLPNYINSFTQEINKITNSINKYTS